MGGFGMSEGARKAGYRPVSSRQWRYVTIGDGITEHSGKFPRDAVPWAGDRPKLTGSLCTERTLNGAGMLLY